MAINIETYPALVKDAVTFFWTARASALQAQEATGERDAGNRGAVTTGKNMDGFVDAAKSIILQNGATPADVITDGRTRLTLPGFFRPTKNWDLLVVRGDRLAAVLEFKSQVGSFGNNFNNRCEEALGNSTDILKAFREGAFGDAPRPFLGYIMVLEDCDGSTTPVRFQSPHFPAFPEFLEKSYAERYEILCRKLVQEGLYDAAALVLTNRESGREGVYRELSEGTGLRRYFATLAGKIASFTAE